MDKWPWFQLRRWPITLLGIVTVAIWLLMISGSLPPTSEVLRIVTTPVYMMRLLIVAAQVTIWGLNPPTVIDLLTMPLLLTPYVLLDVLSWRLLQNRRKRAG